MERDSHFHLLQWNLHEEDRIEQGAQIYKALCCYCEHKHSSYHSHFILLLLHNSRSITSHHLQAYGRLGIIPSRNDVMDSQQFKEEPWISQIGKPPLLE